MSKKSKDFLKCYIYPIAQLLVGLLFLFSGIAKGIDPMGTAIKINEYLAAFGFAFGRDLAIVASVALNLFEALLGMALLLGVYPKMTGRLSLAFILPMTLLTLYIYLFNPVADCGCFGDALKISNAETFWKNILLLFIITRLSLRPDAFYRICPKRYDTSLVAISALLLLYLNLYPLRYLPVIDWRPYKIGASIAQLTGADEPEGAFDYTFVYERGGEQKVFTMEQLADLDSTWHYVSTEVHEVDPPNEVLGADFILMDSEGYNWTPHLAEEKSDILLYIVLDATRLDDEEWHLGYTIGEELKKPVWLVVSNSIDEVARLPQAAEYDKVLTLDRSTALTVIRNHPGIVYIKKGQIQDKRSGYELKQLLKRGTLATALTGDNPKRDRQEHRKHLFAPLLLFLGTLLLTARLMWRRDRR